MQKYIAQRLLLAIPTIFLVTIVTFFGLRLLLDADATDIIIGEYAVSDETRQALEEDLGLSGSIISQYTKWVGLSWFWGGETGLIQGNLGESLHSNRPVLDELKNRVPVSFELGMWGLVLSVLISVPLGVYSALRQDHFPDYGLRSFAIFIAAIPNFWIAVLLITLGSVWLGYAPPINYKDFWEDPLTHVWIMLAPGLIIGLTPSGSLIRLVRTQMLEVLRQDYIRTAQAKGLSQNTVLYKHALRNALIPIVTVVGVGLSNIVAGTVLFERIFVIPGMGQYLIDAINNLDFPVIEGVTVIFALLLTVSVILVDISYALLDPRIRLS